MFDFVFRMFSTGNATLPAAGMQAIPQQLAGRLEPGTLRLSTKVGSIANGRVELEGGESIAAREVIIATDAAAAHHLLPDPPAAPLCRQVACLYFAADKAPVAEPWLILNGDGQGPINNLCFPSQVADPYAPPDQTLVSVTVLENEIPDASPPNEQLTARVQTQLIDWFGVAASDWRHLRTVWIPDALPVQAPPALSPVIKPARISDQLLVCGDHRHTASIQGAMESGRLAAEAVNLSG